MKISVQSYSGYKADERPIKFWVSERPLFVESIEEQWRGTDSVYFRIRADDGKTYVLRHSETADEWTLEKSPERSA
jgi:hypothetical protein